MLNFSVKHIAEITHGDVIQSSSNVIVKRILTDSRTLTMPAFTLFVAIKGINHDGHNYIQELYRKGVRCFLVQNIVKPNVLYPEASFIVVKDSIFALQQLAAYHRSTFQIPVTAITGSNGKTVVKEWLSDLLTGYKFVVRSPKSYNSQLGVPLSVLQMTGEHELAVFEAGISQPGEMARLQTVINPDIGIFTNIGPAHQEYFQDTPHKINEKLQLFKNCKQLIYCLDHSLVHCHIQKAFPNSKIEFFTWSLSNKEANVFVNQLYILDSETQIELLFKNKNYHFIIPFIDKASIENILNCASWWLMMEYDFEYFAKQVNLLSSISMRLEVREGINNSIIINDAFNSDLFSLKIAVDSLIYHSRNRKKVVILSDILQSGYNQELLYSEIADIMERSQVDYFIGVGGNISSYSGKFVMPSFFFSDALQLINNLYTLPLQGAAILLKGSRSFRFEDIAKHLELKMHETVFEVNLNAISHNLNYFRNGLALGTKMMVMVKAFSYGAGLLEVANILQYQRVDYLAVAFPDEGVELRRNGISTPIMVMNPDTESFRQMIEFNLEPEIYNFRVFQGFLNEVIRAGISAFPIHIKIDTGMHRLGFEWNDIPLLNEMIEKNEKYIRIASVFSHLAAADDEVEDTFTQYQIQLFKDISEKIIKNLSYSVFRHIANTSAIERFPEAGFDMVRLGIGLYGVSKNKAEQLIMSGRLKTIISQIKDVKQGDTVGYNRKGIVSENKRIATVPVGYADGLFRLLSNGKGLLKVNNKLVPIIGNICMDMCMLDISGIEASEGDEVIIFENSDDLYRLSEAAQTIPYEILTHISLRVKRIYIQE